jgi:hypothetical protein
LSNGIASQQEHDEFEKKETGFMICWLVNLVLAAADLALAGVMGATVSDNSYLIAPIILAAIAG